MSFFEKAVLMSLVCWWIIEYWYFYVGQVTIKICATEKETSTSLSDNNDDNKKKQNKTKNTVHYVFVPLFPGCTLCKKIITINLG